VQRRNLAARFELEPRLLAHADVRVGRPAIGRERERERERAERGERADRSRHKLSSLNARYAGDKRQMIVFASFGGAVGQPRAHLAMLDRIGIVVRGDLQAIVRHCLEH
jgi:hypothetical protein